MSLLPLFKTKPKPNSTSYTCRKKFYEDLLVQSARGAPLIVLVAHISRFPLTADRGLRVYQHVQMSNQAHIQKPLNALKK